MVKSPNQAEDLIAKNQDQKFASNGRFMHYIFLIYNRKNHATLIR